MRFPRSITRSDAAILLSLFLVALAMRFHLLPMPPYGYEPTEYYYSIHWTHAPPGREDVYGGPAFHSWFEAYQRPFFYLLMAIPAHLSFTAYRVAHIVGAALLAPITSLLLRAHGVRRLFATAAGAVVAVHPLLYVWGAIGYEDTFMTLFFAIGLLLMAHQRSVAATPFFLGAAWIKENAFVGLLFVAVAELVHALRTGTASLHPLRLTRGLTAKMVALPLAPLPLYLSVRAGLGSPGSHTGELHPLPILEADVITTLLLPLVLLGLRWTRTRYFAALALVFPALYTGMHLVLHRSIEYWYHVPSNFLIIVAAAITLDEARLRAHGDGRRWTRAASRAATVAVAALFLALWFAPASAEKSALLQPASLNLVPSIRETNEEMLHHRDQDYVHAVAALPRGPDVTVLFVDYVYPMILPPWIDGIGHVVQGKTRPFGSAPDAWTHWVSAIEDRANATLLRKDDASPLNRAIRTTYADCTVLDEGDYALIHGEDCAGRAARLEKEYQQASECTRDHSC